MGRKEEAMKVTKVAEVDLEILHTAKEVFHSLVAAKLSFAQNSWTNMLMLVQERIPQVSAAVGKNMLAPFLSSLTVDQLLDPDARATATRRLSDVSATITADEAINDDVVKPATALWLACVDYVDKCSTWSHSCEWVGNSAALMQSLARFTGQGCEFRLKHVEALQDAMELDADMDTAFDVEIAVGEADLPFDKKKQVRVA
jgi:hypothetical protein